MNERCAVKVQWMKMTSGRFQGVRLSDPHLDSGAALRSRRVAQQRNDGCFVLSVLPSFGACIGLIPVFLFQNDTQPVMARLNYMRRRLAAEQRERRHWWKLFWKWASSWNSESDSASVPCMSCSSIMVINNYLFVAHASIIVIVYEYDTCPFFMVRNDELFYHYSDKKLSCPSFIVIND